MSASEPLDFPLEMGLSLLLLAGYLLRTLFVSFNLPGPVGVLLSGWLCAKLGLMQTEILDGRDHFQECAFFLVLLTAGFEISHNIPKFADVILGIVPCCCEFTGIALWSAYMEGLSRIEACVTGVVLCGLADGIVIPKMIEIEQQFREGSHAQMPIKSPALTRKVLTLAPLEASFVLTFFGLLSGFAEVSKSPTADAVTVLGANFVRLLATVILGIALGRCTGWIMQQRTSSVGFTRKPEETYLFILAVALAAFGLGLPKESGGTPLVPMGFAPGSLFQPELLVIVLGCSFSQARQADTELVEVVGGVWVFGQIFLFSMIGSKIDLTVFGLCPRVVPMLLLGLLCRFGGVFLSIVLALWWETQQLHLTLTSEKQRMLWFMFLSSLPRASLQGALGFVPQNDRFFHSDMAAPDKLQVRSFIADSSRLYIILMSVAGSMLLHLFGPGLLQEGYQQVPPEVADQESGQQCREAAANTMKSRERSVSFLDDSLAKLYPLESTKTTRTTASSALGPVESEKQVDTWPDENDATPNSSDSRIRRRGTGTYSVPLLVEDEGLHAMETLAGIFGQDPASFSKRLYDTFGVPLNADQAFFKGTEAHVEEAEESIVSESVTYKESLMALNRF